MSRPRLTGNQRIVLLTIQRMDKGGERWVKEQYVGARITCWHLHDKGYIERREVIGPRGGTTYEYRSIP